MLSERFNLNRQADYDVVGIGSALLDIIINVEPELLDSMGLSHGEMKLIEADESRAIFDRIGEMPRSKVPGGSAANTLAGVANFGGSAMLIGSLGVDEYGDLYIMETRVNGVEPVLVRHEGITGHAITFITPDTERTFATHLGAALSLSADDVRQEEIARARILHLEGYLLEPENLREAALKAMDIAKRNNVLVSLDLSDPALIERIYDTFRHVVSEYVDIVFVNELEARAFTGREHQEALHSLALESDYAVVKLGAQGSLIMHQEMFYEVPAFATDVINTNGAGDMYAAGILYGIARGYSPEKAGRIASYASSMVVARMGARIPGRIDYSSL